LFDIEYIKIVLSHLLRGVDGHIIRFQSNLFSDSLYASAGHSLSLPEA
jgi:hypothetical protein